MQIHEDKGCHCLALGYENYNLIGGFIAEVWISHSSKNWGCVFVCIDKTTNPCLPSGLSLVPFQAGLGMSRSSAAGYSLS